VPTSYGIEVNINAVLLRIYLQPGSNALVKLYYGQNRLFEIVESEEYSKTNILTEYCIIPEYDDLIADWEQDKYEATLK